jgi:ABC-type lipopolysaccharide export system ATPase subunit
MVFLSSNSVCSVAKKPSNDRVIQRVTDRAHRTKYASLLEPTGKGKRGILTTMVRVVNQPILWTTVPNGHVYRTHNQISHWTLSHAPAHNLSGEGIDHSGEVEPAFVGGMLCYVGNPQPTLTQSP